MLDRQVDFDYLFVCGQAIKFDNSIILVHVLFSFVICKVSRKILRFSGKYASFIRTVIPIYIPGKSRDFLMYGKEIVC